MTKQPQWEYEPLLAVLIIKPDNNQYSCVTKLRKHRLGSMGLRSDY
jgi:hypothetical protein